MTKIRTVNAEKKYSDAVILGNGPSLNYSLEHHKDFLTNKDIFCVNLFSSTSYYQEIKPNNYILLDDAFTNKNHERANTALMHIVNDTNWPVNLHVPFRFKNSEHFIKNIEKNENIKPVYFNYVIFSGFDFLRFWIYKNDWGMPQSQNVLVASIFRCVNMTYNSVFLLGADHTWHENIKLNIDNEIIADDAHFYGNKSYEISKIVNKNESYLAKQFLSLHKAFKGYEVLGRYADFRGVKIINASKRSFIDVFDKIKLS
ncbi:MAG: hypothetical protein IPH28_16660 [Cytophagaceae bacterium]|nr:hypothetical protein [Cytophagaceae bacterium]MBK9508266.1 hypothetical protein [Cytophagaceae bacterium]MBK9933962.1 hypothetical protein [Cytophagaceae bacterium]MBL0327351.1 hypothetical protein [Cytophagaceae bacterium]